METTVETQSPALSMSNGKPSMAWAIWTGVVVVTSGVAALIAYLATKKDKKVEEAKEEKPAAEKPAEPQQ